MAKKKSKTSVNVEAVKRDVKKMAAAAVKDLPPNQSHTELPSGSVRKESPLEQEMGSRRYREMIHDHNTKNKHILDRLPFTFPPKKKICSHLDVALECPNCGTVLWGSENTVGVICESCRKFVKPRNPEAESRGYDPQLNVGILGTASDKLKLLGEKDKKKRQ